MFAQGGTSPVRQHVRVSRSRFRIVCGITVTVLIRTALLWMVFPVAVLPPAYGADAAADKGGAAKKESGAAKKEGTAAPEPSAEARAAELAAKYGSICQAEIHYYWRIQREAKKGSADLNDTATLAYYTTLNEEGRIEEDARLRLTNRLTAAQAQAIETCKEEHENEAGCIEKRLGNLSRTYAVLDYSTRKVVMTSVLADCKASLGICLTAEVSPIKCWAGVPPDANIPFTQPKETVVDTVQTGVTVTEGMTNGTKPTTASSPTLVKPKVPTRPPRTREAPIEPSTKDPQFGTDPKGATPEDNPFSKPFNL